MLTQTEAGVPLLLKEGQVIKEDPASLKKIGLTQHDIAKGRKDKTLVEVIVGQQPLSQHAAPRPDGIAKAPPLSSHFDEQLPGDTASGLIPPPLPHPATGAPAGTAPGIWSYDPATLQGHPLLDLNQLIATTDPSMEPFETVEEAIAQLSREFVPDDRVTR